MIEEMKRKALTEKIAVIGVDGFDPKLAKKYLDEGKMPNLKKFMEKGSCRKIWFYWGSAYRYTTAMDNISYWSLSGNPRNYLLLWA